MRVADLKPGDVFYMDDAYSVESVELITPDPREYDDWRGLPHWIVRTDRGALRFRDNATVSETYL